MFQVICEVRAEQIPLMLAKRWDRIDRSKVEYPVFIEPKIDGVRLITYKSADKFKVITRYGYELDLDDPGLEQGVYDSEAWKPGIDFNTMQGEVRKGDYEGLEIVVFDYLTVDEWDNKVCRLEQWERRARLESKPLKGIYKLIDVELVKNEEEVNAAFQEAVGLGLEGIMIKESKAHYRWDRGGKWYKYKKKDLEDAFIIGYEEGSGRLEGSLGALIVQTSDDRIYKVGAGFTDKERAHIWKHRKELLGKWIEVEYQEKTEEAVRMPRFIRFKI